MDMHEKRKCKCAKHEGDEAWHGRAVGSTYHYCRCRTCSEGNGRRTREWRQANPERRREQERRWRATNPERAREVGRASEAQSREARRAKTRAWQKANPAAVRGYAVRRKALVAVVDATATRTGPWVRAEEIVAQRDDLTAVDVARLLGRTVRAVQARRSKLRKAAANA